MDKCRLFLVLMLFFCGSAFSAGEIPTTPFNIIGYIQSFKLCDPAYIPPASCKKDDPRAAATMKVNGITVIIPENLKIIMPGTYLTAQDIFKGPKGTAAGVLSTPEQSSLALEDQHPPGKPFIPFSAEISGNIAKDPASSKIEYIAGLVNISQGVLQTSAGYIKEINYTKGELLVTPDISNTTNKVRVQLNDPPLPGSQFGRFSKGSIDAKDDNRFTVDQGNPTVHAMTGYPVCIPAKAAGDPDRCPESNRPKDDKGVHLRRYTMASEGTPPEKRIPVAGTKFCDECNSNLMAPLERNDYVIFSGIWIDDVDAVTNTTGYISAYSLEANLGIYTSPGTNPAYIAIEESHWGTGGIPFDDIPQETGPGKPAPLPADRILIPGQNLVTRFFIVGATTDPSRNVEVIALDIKPDTGKEKDPPRVLAVIVPEQTAPLGRFRRTVEQSVFLPPTREIKAHIVGTASESKDDIANGLEWGQYTAPVGEYLFPEGRNWGSPEVPMNFENLCFLAHGEGPLNTLGREENPGVGCIDGKCLVGQLMPWPDSGHAITDPRAAGFCDKPFTSPTGGGTPP
jgi:hypothetical protein